MRKKFFERTYLTTLILFLVFLNGAVLTLALYSHERRIDATKQICLTEQYAVCQAFETDYDGRGNGSDYILQVAYGDFYREKGIGLCFTDESGKVTDVSIRPNTPMGYESMEVYILSKKLLYALVGGCDYLVLLCYLNLEISSGILTTVCL